MTRIIYLTSLIILLSQMCNGQTYTLDQLIMIGEGQNIDQQRSELGLQMANLEIETLDAAQGWRLSADANIPSYLKSSRSVVQPNGSIAFQNVSQNTGRVGFTLSKPIIATNSMLFAETNLLRFDDFTQNFNIYNGTPIRVGIRQPINRFNTAKWDRRILTKREEVLNRQNDQIKKVNALLISQQYFGVLHAQINQEIASSNLKNNQEIYRIGQERHKLGKISESDLLQIELSVKNSQQAVLSSQREVIQRSFSLKEAANAYDLEKIIRVDAPAQLPTLQDLPENIAQQAWDNHPDKNELELKLLEAQRDLDKANKESGFSADLQASVGLVKSGNQLNDVYQSPKPQAMVNLQMSIPIIDGGYRKKSLERIRMQEQMNRLNHQYSEATFKQNITQMIEQLAIIQQEVSMSKESFDIAVQRYNIANERFTLGNINITDLYIAYGERDRAWRNYIFSLERYFNGYYTVQTMIE